jgi:hypothetical protein
MVILRGSRLERRDGPLCSSRLALIVPAPIWVQRAAGNDSRADAAAARRA